jgi:hypothetical protein
MNKFGHPVVTLAILLIGALLAAVIMLQLSSGSSLVAFIGWTVFFVTLQLPWLFVRRAGNCVSWLSRNRSK